MNKRSNSFVFDSISEALYYQELIGGRLAILNKYQVEKGGEKYLEDLDEWIEEPEYHKAIDKECYIITQKCEAELTNGFCYIKELVYQLHNDYVDESYQTLKQNNIIPYSVKTDALTISSSDLQQAKELLNFKKERGAWRTQDDFTLPTTFLYTEDKTEFLIEDIEQTRIEIPDEWDSQYIAKKNRT